LAVVGVLLDAGFQINARRFDLPNSRPQTVKQLRQQAETERSSRILELEQLLRDARSRMASGLQLVHVPDVAARLENVEPLRKRLAAISETHQALERAWHQILRLREVRNVLQLLLSTIESDRISDALHQQIMRLSGVATNAIGQIRVELFNTSYPFQHAKGKISVADFALAKVPDGEQPFEVVRSANEMLEKLIGLYFRVMAHLAVCAEKVEEALGLPPLPEPPEEEP